MIQKKKVRLSAPVGRPRKHQDRAAKQKAYRDAKAKAAAIAKVFEDNPDERGDRMVESDGVTPIGMRLLSGGYSSAKLDIVDTASQRRDGFVQARCTMPEGTGADTDGKIKKFSVRLDYKPGCLPGRILEGEEKARAIEQIKSADASVNQWNPFTRRFECSKCRQHFFLVIDASSHICPDLSNTAANSQEP